MSASRQEFDRIIGPIEHQMIRTVWHVLGDVHDAEDALQDALIVILKKWRRVTRHKNPHALVIKMCTDCAIDHLRRKVRGNLRYQELRTLENRSVLAGPSDQLTQAELRDQIMCAIAKLSRKQSLAFLLRTTERQSYENIASSLDCSVATARKHVARARSRLAVLLEPLAPTEKVHHVRSNR